MNKSPASLIPADHGSHSMGPDRDNLGITAYDVRPGAVYLSGERVINWAGGPWSAPFWAVYMGLQTCGIFSITAPSPWQKGDSFQSQYTPLFGTGQAPIGQAPTSGVYTGVHEEGCS